MDHASQKLGKYSLQILPGADSPAAMQFSRELFRTYRFAHHPTCQYYDHHLIRIGKYSLCIGCTCMWGGVVLSIICLVLSAIWLPGGIRNWAAWDLVAIGLLLFAPTIAQPWLQVRPYKILARVMLGCSITLLWFGGMVLLPLTLSGYMSRLLFMLIFWRVYKMTQGIRNKYAKSPCANCTEGTYPFCNGNHDRVLHVFNQLKENSRPEDAPFIAVVQATIMQNQMEIRISK